MPPSHPALRIAIGLVLGVLFAGAGIWAGSRGDTAQSIESPAATTTTAIPSAADQAFSWVDPAETVLGPAVVVPAGFEVSGDELVFSYELYDISPAPQGYAGPNASDAAAAPELWTLATSAGETFEASTTAASRTARFPVPEGFDPATISAITIDSWRIRLPISHYLEIAHDDQAPHEVEPGTTVALRLILPQAQNTLVQFAVDHSVDGFSGGSTTFSAAFESQPGVRGIGPGWTNIGFTETGLQLTYVGGELPDPFPVRVDTHEWFAVREPVEIDLGGVLRG